MRMEAMLLMASLVVASAASAAEKTLYIKAHDAKVLKAPSATADELGTVNFGDEVTWLEAAERPFHKVSATVTVTATDTDRKKKGRKAAPTEKTAKVEGYLLQQNLSSNKPETEVASSGTHRSALQALSSSGAATKAMSEAGLKYAEKKKGSVDAALKGLISTEAVAKSVKDEDTRKLGCAVNGGCQ